MAKLKLPGILYPISLLALLLLLIHVYVKSINSLMLFFAPGWAPIHYLNIYSCICRELWYDYIYWFTFDVFQREPVLKKELGKVKLPNRIFTFQTRIWRPRNWVISQHTYEGHEIIPTVISDSPITDAQRRMDHGVSYRLWWSYLPHQSHTLVWSKCFMNISMLFTGINSFGKTAIISYIPNLQLKMAKIWKHHKN